ncbi:zinc-ribbon domain-containing protein [Geomonas oryzisoli]|uniref:Zinc-ribbon domain-containing protein n=1 Tax=Geomonas oryzisoli TaxID=2847992 RepID=A0ABX8J0T2_9BACT|nr:zinc-ribbon domain-containing protein [Geomonas oryzisoli]QWV91823.1 zinc-ribbon domain-containing protein [Geomonas oryzisoli]
MSELTITCPSCGYSRAIPHEKIPAGTVQVSCPRCKSMFPLHSVCHDRGIDQVAPETAPVLPAPALTDQSVKQGGQRARALLLFFVLLVLLFVGVRIWAEGKIRELPFPNFIATSDTGVAVTWGEEVLLFDRNGAQTGRQPLPPGAVPTQLSYVGNELWLADHTGNAIRRLRNNRWETVVNGGNRFRAAYKFVVDGGDIFVTDSANHKIHQFRTDGSYLRSFGQEGKEPGQFKFPNTILLDRDGNLVVANTNCFRIDLFARDGRFLKTIATAKAEGAYRFPTLLCRADDRYAFLQTVDLRQALVLVYGADGSAVGKLPLPVPLEEAGDVAAFGSTVLVSDMGHREVYRFDAATLQYKGAFSTAISHLARDTGRLEDRYAAISSFALTALLVCCLPAFYLYYQTRRREEKRIRSVDAGIVVPADALVVTGTDGRKLVLAAAVFVLSLLLMLYGMPRFGHNRIAMLSVMLLNTLLTLAMIRLLVESGRVHPSRRELVLKMVRSAAPNLAQLLVNGERVMLCTGLRRSFYLNQPTLLLLTDQRILLVDFAALRPAGYWQLGYGDISIVNAGQVKSPMARLNRMVKIDSHRVLLTLQPRAGIKELLLHSNEATVVGQVAAAIKQRLPGGRLGYSKLCATCYTALDSGGCPNCRTERKGNYKPLLLSLVYPGLGQFYNREILKGTVLCLFFTCGALSLTIPVIQIMDRTAETTPDSVPLLLSSVLTTVSLYLIAIADADLVGRQGRRLFSREFFRLRR